MEAYNREQQKSRKRSATCLDPDDADGEKETQKEVSFLTIRKVTQIRTYMDNLFLYFLCLCIQDEDPDYAAIRQARMFQDFRPKYRRRTVSFMERTENKKEKNVSNKLCRNGAQKVNDVILATPPRRRSGGAVLMVPGLCAMPVDFVRIHVLFSRVLSIIDSCSYCRRLFEITPQRVAFGSNTTETAHTRIGSGFYLRAAIIATHCSFPDHSSARAIRRKEGQHNRIYYYYLY